MRGIVFNLYSNDSEKNRVCIYGGRNETYMVKCFIGEIWVVFLKSNTGCHFDIYIHNSSAEHIYLLVNKAPSPKGKNITI